MNNTPLPFLAKILIGSLGISLVLKYVGPLLSIPATATAALVPVFGVPLAVAVFLAWRSMK
jgi:hypothetical protein